MSKTETAKILLKGLVAPAGWTNPAPAGELKTQLEKYFQTRVFPINSGRAAIYSILKSTGIGEGDEVIIQAYTCNAVPNPVLWASATPIYSDIDEETLNVNPESLKEKITAKTKAIILQHTFGRPGPIEEVLEIAKNHNLLVIEDCAHSLGAEYKGKKLGTFGDFAIVSFGREKVISSLSGGAILVNNKRFIGAIDEFTKGLSYPSFITYLKEFNNFFTWRLLIRKVFFSGFGAGLLNFLNSQDFFNVVTSSKELSGEKPPWYPAAFPGTFAKIALLEFPKIDEINQRRNEIAHFYEKNIKNGAFRLLPHHEGIYLRFVVLHENPTPIFEEAKKRHFWFGNWYSSPIYPSRADIAKMHYDEGTCPVAEKIASQTINLPNYVGMKDDEVQEVVGFINNY